MQNSLLRSIFKNQLIQNSLFMPNNLLGSLFKKQLIQNSLFMQNNLVRPLLKNSLFKTTYLCKTGYYDLFFKKQFIYLEQLSTISI